MREQFVDAARRSLRIGFDLIELHVGHGYLLHEFSVADLQSARRRVWRQHRESHALSRSRCSTRCEPYGRRIGRSVCACRPPTGSKAAGRSRRLCVFARELKALGCDFIDVTSGQLDPRQKIPLAPGYNVPLAHKVKSETGIPTMAVGLITKPRQAEEIVAGGQADLWRSRAA